MKTKHTKIMLANPPWYDEQRPWLWGVRAGSRWPHMENWTPDHEPPSYMPFPHFLAQATSILEQHTKLNVQLVDSVALGERLPMFFGKVTSFNPDILFMETSTPSLQWDLDIAARLKAQNPNLIIGLGGAHKELQNPDWLTKHPLIDFICFGEYEQSLEEHILNFNNNKSDKVAGMHHRTSASEIIAGDPRPPCHDLDSYPRYAYHFLPMHRYTDCPIGKGPSVQVWTSRGCPFGCSFCVWPQVVYNERKFRVRSVKKVVDEIEWLIKTYNFESFYLDDDTVNVNKKRTIELASEIKSRRLGVPWSMMARADCMDKETLEACYESGMRTVKYGVESGSQALINSAGKNLKISKIIDTCRWTKELGIRMHLTFMMGLPGETRQTAEETINLAIQLDPDTLQFSICTPFPGTELYTQAQEEGWLVENTTYDGFNDSSLNLPTITARELEEIHHQAKQRWQEHCSKRADHQIVNQMRAALSTIPAGSRMAIYGVGKFTRKIFPHLKDILKESAIDLIGFLDDSAIDGTTFSGHQIIKLTDAAQWKFDHLFLSSDAFQDVMAEKASKILPDCHLIRIG